MLILDKIRQIKDKKIAVELAKWCAKEAAADAEAEVEAEAEVADAADVSRAARLAARAAADADAVRVAGDSVWAASDAVWAAYWAAMAAARAAEAAYWAAEGARAAADADAGAAWAARVAKCEQIASKLKELTGETFYYCCIDGSRHILEQLNDQIKIGCISETKEWWLENYEEKGKENGYSEEQIKEYGEYINANSR